MVSLNFILDQIQSFLLGKLVISRIYILGHNVSVGFHGVAVSPVWCNRATRLAESTRPEITGTPEQRAATNTDGGLWQYMPQSGLEN